jgi:RNA polymerase sigma factor (sigma-70 family)
MRPTAQPRPRTSHHNTLKPLAGRELDAHDIAFVHGTIRTSPAAAMLDDDDAFSVGLIAYWRAAVRYDPGRGMLWVTYAGNRIRNALQDEARLQDHLTRPHRREVTANGGGRAVKRPASLDEPLRMLAPEAVVGDPGAPTLASTLKAPPEEDIDLRLTVDAAYEAIHRVNPKIAAVMRLYYQHGWRDQDIAEFFGVGESRVSQLKTIGREMLRELLPLDLLDAA